MGLILFSGTRFYICKMNSKALKENTQQYL